MAPLHPQWERLREQRAQAGTPPLYTLPLEKARADDLAALRATGGEPEAVARVEETEIPGPGGPLTLRLYRPSTASGLPVLLYLYGGGWVLGCPDTADGVARALANAAGCVVAVVGYRLAPEHPFPAAVHDSAAALTWLYEHAPALGLDPQRVAVGGDSAGGNLAAALTLLWRERQGPPLRHQLLIYPNTEYRPAPADGQHLAAGARDRLTSADADRDPHAAPAAEPVTHSGGPAPDAEDPLLFNPRSVAWYWAHYLAAPEDGDNPLASPLRAEKLTGLPPATVLTAEYDPLRDEGERYAERLRADGVPVELHRFPGMAHGFFTMTGTIDAARTAQQLAAARLGAAFAGAGTGAGAGAGSGIGTGADVPQKGPTP